MQVFEKCKIFKSFAEKQLEGSIKCLRIDNGREHAYFQFNKFIEENGIQRQLTVSYTPQKNGIAERANRIIVEMALSRILYSGVAEVLWTEAINTAVYVRNRCQTNKTPFEVKCNIKPKASHFRVFGLPVVAKGMEYVFVGYSNTAKA